MSTWCRHHTEQLTELLYSFRSFKLSSMQYSEPVVIQTRSESRNEIDTHRWNTLLKNTIISFNCREAIWSLTNKKKTRKQERKANNISLHWTVKIARRLNGNMPLVSETSHKQNHGGIKPQSGSKWKTYRLSAMILHSLFNLAIQFRRQGPFGCLRLRLSKCLNSTQACHRCDPLNINRQSR